MYASLIAVILGGSFGCVTRWFISFKLNGLFQNLPLGTLMVNLVGGFVIGMAMAFFLKFPAIDPAWKLLITTGFCGGLTTFSAFSVEVMFTLQQGRLAWAAAIVTVHVIGSLLMTFGGFALMTKLTTT